MNDNTHNAVIGIDPGKDGAVARYGADGDLYIELTPTVKVTKREYDVADMRRLLNSLAGHATFAFLEKQQAWHGQGVTSMFSIGQGYGLWEGLLVGLGIPYQVVRPQTWQREMLRDVQGKGKARAILAATRMFPDTDFRRTPKCKGPHDGKCDAAMIAVYGHRYLLGQAK